MNLDFSVGWLELFMMVLGALAFAFAIWRWLMVQFNQTASHIDYLKLELGQAAQTSLENYAFSHDAKMEELKAQLGQGLGLIAMVAGIAPMMGLLGTVSGMIETFQAMHVSGSSDLAVMSSGIAKALYTTELGLIIAVPLVIMHAMIRQKINHIVMQTEKGLLDELMVRA